MAKTVDEAFEIFMDEKVNPSHSEIESAIKSQKHITDVIDSYDGDDFFHLCKEYNEQFGSFARGTKKKKIDDLDLMFGMMGLNAAYDGSDPWYDVRIYGDKYDDQQKSCMDENGLLNSRLVLNKFRDRLAITYTTSDNPSRNGEAVTLSLTNWTIDVVPCFFTKMDENGRCFYLIPNGCGNWQKTDPTIDRRIVNSLDKKHNNRLLPLIRLCKKWNEVKKIKTLPSYLLETILVNFASEQDSLSQWIDSNFLDALEYLEKNISKPIFDMKGIQGDISYCLGPLDRLKIAQRAQDDVDKIYDAQEAEFDIKDQEKAINLWREIFGQEFPTYG